MGWFHAPLMPPYDFRRYDGVRFINNSAPCNQPPVIAAVGAAAVAAAGKLVVGAKISAALTSALVAGVSSLVLSGLSAALAPDPPSGADAGSFASIRNTGVTRQIRQPVTERRVVYGEARVSGPIVLVSSTNDNDFLHLVIALASHEVEEIGEVFINDVSITDDMLDGNSLVNTGRYDGLVRIEKALGADNQVANANLVSEVAEWTTNHRLRGIAYLYARVKWDRDAFPGGIPNFSAWVKGKKVLDTRDSVTRWTPNIALQARDYLTNDDYGLGTADANIDTTELSATANTCEEFVTTLDASDTFSSVATSTDIITLIGVDDRLIFQTGQRVQLTTTGTLPAGLATLTDYYIIVVQRKDTPRIKLASSYANAIAGTAVDITSSGTGTHTITRKAEPRYIGGGVLKTNSERGKNLQELLSGMGGQAVYAGGVWRLLAAEYQTPTISYTVDDLAGPIKIQPGVSRRDRFNVVQGIYTSPLNDGNPSDYPIIESATFQSDDNGEVLLRNLDLPFTQSPSTAQRIAKIDLQRSRQEIIWDASFKLSAFKNQVGDNIEFTESRYGWASKVFEVIDWSLSVDNLTPVINMKLRENTPSVYDWVPGDEETQVDPAPNTSLPNPFTVSVVGGFSLDSVLVDTQSTDKIFTVLATWDLSSDAFVLNGGIYEIEFKEATEADDSYKSAGKIDGDISEFIIAALKPDILYDIRIIAYNSLNVGSTPTLIEDFKVGDTVTTNTEDWENETIAARDGQDWEVDNLPNEDFES